MKTTFYIVEIQNQHAYRKAQKIFCKDLTSAKALASKAQVFHGTTLAIGRAVDDNGFIVDTICQKFDGKWY